MKILLFPLRFPIALRWQCKEKQPLSFFANSTWKKKNKEGIKEYRWSFVKHCQLFEIYICDSEAIWITKMTNKMNLNEKKGSRPWS